MNSYRYPNGREIPANVVLAIRFTGKVGFLSGALWHDFFGIGTTRWKDQQLQFLSESQYFKRHRTATGKSYWVLGDRGIELLKENKDTRVTPVSATHLRHDEVVARAMLTLLKENLLRAFHVEREMKTYGVKQFLLSNKDHDQKYPDAVFKMTAFGGTRIVAVEYERERKSSSRYKNILFQYANLTQLSMVLFIVENSGIRKAIEGAMKHLGQTVLMDKLAFVDAEDWKKSPLTAPIHLKSGAVKLGEICTKVIV